MQIKNVMLISILLFSFGAFTSFVGPRYPKYRAGVDAALRLRLGDIYFDTGKNIVSKKSLLRYIDSPLVVVHGSRKDTLLYYEVTVLPLHGDYSPPAPGRFRHLNYAIRQTILNSDTASFFFSKVLVRTPADSLCHQAYGFWIRMQ